MDPISPVVVGVCAELLKLVCVCKMGLEPTEEELRQATEVAVRAMAGKAS